MTAGAAQMVERFASRDYVIRIAQRIGHLLRRIGGPAKILGGGTEESDGECRH
jgi:hypothetical protein